MSDRGQLMPAASAAQNVTLLVIVLHFAIVPPVLLMPALTLISRVAVLAGQNTHPKQKIGPKGEITMTLTMTPTITAFERSPDGGKGLARDMRVRWALEEVGQPYNVRLVSFSEMKQPAHRVLHPFAQIPTYEESDLALFESGAIVFHIAERHTGLLPDDANSRARAINMDVCRT